MSSPLNSPFHGDVKSPPSPNDGSCNHLEHTEVRALMQSSDTSVLKEAFYADSEALKWSPGALMSPMGTGIVNPKSSPK